MSVCRINANLHLAYLLYLPTKHLFRSMGNIVFKTSVDDPFSCSTGRLAWRQLIPNVHCVVKSLGASETTYNGDTCGTVCSFLAFIQAIPQTQSILEPLQPKKI